MGTTRTRLRSGWSLYSAFLLVLCALIPFGALTATDGLTENSLAIACGTAFVAAAERASLGGVALVGSSIRVRSLFRTRMIPLVEVTDVRAEIVEHKVLDIWAPVISLRDSEEVLALRLLAGYSLKRGVPNARVQRSVELLDSWRASVGSA